MSKKISCKNINTFNNTYSSCWNLSGLHIILYNNMIGQTIRDKLRMMDNNYEMLASCLLRNIDDKLKYYYPEFKLIFKIEYLEPFLIALLERFNNKYIEESEPPQLTLLRQVSMKCESDILYYFFINKFIININYWKLSNI